MVIGAKSCLTYGPSLPFSLSLTLPLPSPRCRTAAPALSPVPTPARAVPAACGPSSLAPPRPSRLATSAARICAPSDDPDRDTTLVPSAPRPRRRSRPPRPRPAPVPASASHPRPAPPGHDHNPYSGVREPVPPRPQGTGWCRAARPQQPPELYSPPTSRALFIALTWIGKIFEYAM